jgi:hypothetical protein
MTGICVTSQIRLAFSTISVIVIRPASGIPRIWAPVARRPGGARYADDFVTERLGHLCLQGNGDERAEVTLTVVDEFL